MGKESITVEIWSDIMCPFCYIGKRHFETALEQLKNVNAKIEWKSFQLDPSIPEKMPAKTGVYEYLASRKGITREQSAQMHQRVEQMAAAAGLNYRFDKAVIANSFKAHRIIQKAKEIGLGDRAEEIFFDAYFTQGMDLADTSTLKNLAEKIGLKESDVDAALTDDRYASLVKHDVQEAEQIGVNGVPFFVFNRKYAVSGAQPVSVFVKTMEKAAAE